jgi:calcineurin-like phosphoesterase family protein
MTIFFTADHHFSHAGIIGLSKRPYLSAEEMDEALVANWNAVVGKRDTVYHLGDLTLGPPSLASKFLVRLNGAIRLVPGNHDQRWSKDFLRNKRSVDNLVIEPPFLSRKFGSRRITLCHYPMASWPSSSQGALHFHGHWHGTGGLWSRSGDARVAPGMGPGGRVDVGVDCWDFAPVSLDTLIEKYG